MSFYKQPLVERSTTMIDLMSKMYMARSLTARAHSYNLTLLAISGFRFSGELLCMFMRMSLIKVCLFVKLVNHS
jgi:hypothetical protein